MLLSVEKLSKNYGSQRAVDGINFQARPGEILGFLGPNGAGKTTTMKMITCFLSPDAGTVRLGEFNIHEHPTEVRRRIGYLAEHNPLYHDMYVHEYLHFAGKMQEMNGKEVKKRVPELIEKTGLQGEQHKRIGMLSKGYRQRVGLAQALLHDPPVLILDEPTTGLDPNQIVDIRSLIRTLGSDKTVIFSSHILPEVEATADRVVIINQGKLVAESNISQLGELDSAERILHVETSDPGLDLTQLEAWPEVMRIEVASPTKFSLYLHGESDVRRKLFEVCAAGDTYLLELRQQQFNLEAAFRRATRNRS